jgi:hypothetical protein
MAPEGHTIEDIKKREQIIRDFYREWKREESISTKVQPFVEGIHQHQNGFREKTNSGESPVLYNRYIQRVK